MKSTLLVFLAISLATGQDQAQAEGESAAKSAETPATSILTNEVKIPKPSSTTTKASRPVRTQPAAAPLSPVVVAVINMSKAGVELPVIEAYIEEANVPPLRADEVVLLHTNRVTTPVITALLKRSNELRAQQAQAVRNAQEQLAQQRAAQAASFVQSQIHSTMPQGSPYSSYYFNSPPAYNWGFQFNTVPYAFYPTSPYNVTRPVRSQPTVPVSSFNPAARTGGGQSADPSSFFISRWQVNGTTGKPLDSR